MIVKVKPNWKNRTLFHGDNLEFLRAMNSNTVDLIATDPPFNKGRDFHATPDSLSAGAKFQDRWSWEKDVHQDWLDELEDDWPNVMYVIDGSRKSYGDDMGAFLCFMGVRLIAMRRVLKETGSIYLHCDQTAGHYLKELLDAIFGKRNFRNEIIWHYQSGGRQTKLFSKKHENIYLYTKNNAWTFNMEAVGIYRGQEKRNNMKREKDSDGRIFWSIKSAEKIYKYYEDEKLTPPDVWTDISHLQQKDPQRTGYPTQKPLALYERFIKASSNREDIVLDPFAGCATTLVAAERLGRQWVGMDIWDGAHEVVIERLKREGLSDSGRARPDQKNMLLPFGELTYTKAAPVRTDDGETAVAYLRTKVRIQEPEGKKMSRREMYEYLISQNGIKCEGCNREFDDERYLELDHNTPRSDGGLNHITNRVLLCGPCNRLKSNTFTLSGLKKENKKRGYMR